MYLENPSVFSQSSQDFDVVKSLKFYWPNFSCQKLGIRFEQLKDDEIKNKHIKI